MGLIFAGTAYFVYQGNKPVIQRIQEDPTGWANRFRSKWESQTGTRAYEEIVQELIAPKDVSRFKIEMAVCSVILVLLLVTALLWLIIGFFDILSLVAWSCSFLIVLGMFAVYFMRIGIIAFGLKFAYAAYETHLHAKEGAVAQPLLH